MSEIFGENHDAVEIFVNDAIDNKIFNLVENILNIESKIEITEEEEEKTFSGFAGNLMQARQKSKKEAIEIFCNFDKSGEERRKNTSK
jgi:hypothetical protein